MDISFYYRSCFISEIGLRKLVQNSEPHALLKYTLVTDLSVWRFPSCCIFFSFSFWGKKRGGGLQFLTLFWLVSWFSAQVPLQLFGNLWYFWWMFGTLILVNIFGSILLFMFAWFIRLASDNFPEFCKWLREYHREYYLFSFFIFKLVQSLVTPGL